MIPFRIFSQHLKQFQVFCASFCTDGIAVFGSHPPPPYSFPLLPPYFTLLLTNYGSETQQQKHSKLPANFPDKSINWGCYSPPPHPLSVTSSSKKTKQDYFSMYCFYVLFFSSCGLWCVFICSRYVFCFIDFLSLDLELIVLELEI